MAGSYQRALAWALLLAGLVPLLVVAAGAWWILHRSHREVQASATAQLLAVAARAAEQATAAAAAPLGPEQLAAVAGALAAPDSGVTLALAAPDGTVLAGAPLGRLELPAGGQPQWQMVAGQPRLVAAAPLARAATADGPLHLVVLRDEEAALGSYQRARGQLAALALGAAVLTALAAGLVALALGAPVQLLRERAALLVGQGPGGRLPPGGPAELAEIRRALDLLADRAAAGPRAPCPLAASPLRALTFVVFDLETTGLDPRHGDRVVQLGAVRVRAGQVRRDECFETLVHPGRAIPPAATRVHGIDDARVAGAPPLEQVLPAFLDFLGDAVPAAHHAAFDLAFLHPALRALGQPPLDPAAVVDTLRLSQALFPSWGDYSLEALAARFGLPLHGRHTALGDALLAAEVLVRLLDGLALRGVDGLDALLRLQRPRPWERALASVRMHVLHHEGALSGR